MSHTLTSCLSLLLLFAGPCTTAPKQEPVIPKGPWSLKLTTSGGFAGVGRGSISIESDGKFKYEEPISSQQVRKGCKGTMYPRLLQPISDAVAQAQTDGWNRPDLNVAAPDAFSYKLELRTGASPQSTTVRWYDNTSGKLPEDLKPLSAALLQLMKPGCEAGKQ
jgi:hypothetical protein